MPKLAHLVLVGTVVISAGIASISVAAPKSDHVTPDPAPSPHPTAAPAPTPTPTPAPTPHPSTPPAPSAPPSVAPHAPATPPSAQPPAQPPYSGSNPCVHVDFKTELVKQACYVGGQTEAKVVMKAFQKDKKIKSCNDCHTKLAPKYDLKADGLEQYLKAGGK